MLCYKDIHKSIHDNATLRHMRNYICAHLYLSYLHTLHYLQHLVPRAPSLRLVWLPAKSVQSAPTNQSLGRPSAITVNLINSQTLKELQAKRTVVSYIHNCNVELCYYSVPCQCDWYYYQVENRTIIMIMIICSSGLLHLLLYLNCESLWLTCSYLHIPIPPPH